MPRRGNVPKRDVLPDPMYNSTVVAKVVNQVMLDGKKGIAQNIVYDAFKTMSEKLGQEPMDIFNQAIENIKPMVEVKAKRIGGANYQVPLEIREERRQTLAIRWLVIAARKRSERDMSAKLAGELMDAYNNTGAAVKKKEDTHRMAEANRAFAHYKF
ncbi:MAG TPA: 30S ribosomal protein S7 [Clostridiales bacterium]|nr:30S ribosomal protein S7 [Clostridia bacterium]HCY52403.1 30S ribosomal protein S7 [Clostridiales bacterium]